MENLFKKKCFEPEPTPDEASAILDNPQVAKLVRDAVLDFCERSGINSELFIESAKIMPGLGKVAFKLEYIGQPVFWLRHEIQTIWLGPTTKKQSLTYSINWNQLHPSLAQ